jgi:hypothetical protein
MHKKNFVGNPKRKDLLEDLNTNGRILKSILKEQ